MAQKRRIMIVAGEVSGDTHAAQLVSSMREAAPRVEFEFFGSAGPKLRDCGVDAVVNPDDFAVVGVLEIARLLPMFLRAFVKLKLAAVERKPDVVILVDFPEFNLKLAKALKKRGFKIVYYISPQLWAWRKYRIATIRRYVDLVISILPFEKEWYRTYGVDHVEYVGNPLAKEVYPRMSKLEFCGLHKLDARSPVIALLPGSRRTEIVRILPVMLESVAKITADRPDIQFLIAAANTRHMPDIELALKNAASAGVGIPKSIKVIDGAAYDVLNASDAAAVTSGTATLEAGIIGTPMVIVYKLAALNYLLFKPLVSVDQVGLINMIAGRRIVKELIQNDFTAESLAAELTRLLDISVNIAMREVLEVASAKLGAGGASKRAAEAILNLLDITNEVT